MAKSRKTGPTREDGIFKNYPGEKKHDWIDIAALFWRAFKVYFARQKYEQLALDYSWTQQLRTSIQTALQNKENHLWWLGHATFLLYINGTFIITDPAFSNLSSLFPRLFDPIKISEILPPIDIVLISHNHYDHLDKQSIKELAAQNPKIQLLVPEGDKQLCTHWGCKQVSEKSWWDEELVKNNINITFVPAKHWSRRSFFDCNKSLWGGWIISTKDACIYFAGDTAKGDHFREIQTNVPPITHALIPIGPCQPEKENRQAHLDPIEAAEAFQTLNAQIMIPCHWGTYPLGTDCPNAPIDLLRHWWNNQQNLTPEQCIFTLPGQSIPLKIKLPMQTTPSPHKQTTPSELS